MPHAAMVAARRPCRPPLMLARQLPCWSGWHGTLPAAAAAGRAWPHRPPPTALPQAVREQADAGAKFADLGEELRGVVRDAQQQYGEQGQGSPLGVPALPPPLFGEGCGGLGSGLRLRARNGGLTWFLGTLPLCFYLSTPPLLPVKLRACSVFLLC